ncbi:TetR/AcrR family transcriptional regulator [Streptomyces sp. NPDC005474]|uniref:TetR/AcrR family transcriptional regulator n=1 Tax=Streptomyces sp. NPDC005474 TaxID=3154878 RepID=UPI00345335BA
MESICSAGIPAHGPRPAMAPGPDLVTAVVATSFETLADDAEECLQRESHPPWRVNPGFLSRVTDTVAHNRAVKAAAYALGADHAAHPAMQEVETRVTQALGRLIRNRTSPGRSARRLHLDDLYLMLSTLPADQPPTARARWLALLLTGLTAR